METMVFQSVAYVTFWPSQKLKVATFLAPSYSLFGAHWSFLYPQIFFPGATLTLGPSTKFENQGPRHEFGAGEAKGLGAGSRGAVPVGGFQNLMVSSLSMLSRAGN